MIVKTEAIVLRSRRYRETSKLVTAAEGSLEAQRSDTVLTAVDGEESVRLAREEVPDLVLLDLIMPKMQGFEVLRRLKADALTAAIPVVVLSNLGQERDMQQAKELGAVAYFIKADLSLEDLVRQVEAVLAKT